MNRTFRIITVVLIAASVASVFAYKSKLNQMNCPATGECPVASPTPDSVDTKQAGKPDILPVAQTVLPLLLDLGAHTCIPCKMMTPILDELKKEYTGKFKVEFIDVKENPSAGDKYKIEAIPTQIFFDASGKELFRHVGFYPKAEIVKKWQELGVAAQDESKK